MSVPRAVWVFVSALALCACGGGAVGGESSSGDEAGECDESHPCDTGYRCASPEQQAWNRCEGDERGRARCASGEVGDDCGNCFASCLSDADYLGGKLLQGLCESPKECFEL
ncbi:MAG: hypothetical protein R3B99_30540 [Polyangiales bacterium]